jgi:hypothetical protein
VKEFRLDSLDADASVNFRHSGGDSEYRPIILAKPEHIKMIETHSLKLSHLGEYHEEYTCACGLVCDVASELIVTVVTYYFGLNQIHPCPMSEEDHLCHEIIT